MKSIYNHSVLKSDIRLKYVNGFLQLHASLLKLALSVFMCYYSVQNVCAQTIPNAGFEAWTNGVPDGWYDGGLSSFGLQGVVRSTDAQSGLYSVKIVVDPNNGDPVAGVLSTNDGHGIATKLKPAYLNGYVKTNILNTDTIAVIASFYIDDTDSLLEGGGAISTVNRTAWTAFHIPLQYSPSFTPDSFFIFLGFSPLSNVNVNSYVQFDNLSFSNTPIGVPFGPSLTALPARRDDEIITKVYPNPASQELYISLMLKSTSKIDVSFMDITGKRYSAMENQTFTTGRHQVKVSVEDLPTGIYFLNISGDGIYANRKIVISR